MMFKQLFHSFLVGMLIFTSFGNPFPLFAQAQEKADEVEELSPITPILQNNEEENADQNNDIYINTFQSDDQPFSATIETIGEEPAFLEQLENPLSSTLSNDEDILLKSADNHSLETMSSSTLKITEVYRLGTYERIELTNLSDTDFIGSLTLNGVKSSSFILKNITIPAYSSVIVADDKVSGILNTEIFIHSNAALNFTDASPINIELLVDGIILDTFDVDSTTVAAHK
jgi:hypothetical protein